MLQIWILKVKTKEAVITNDLLLNKLPEVFASRAGRYLKTEDSLSYLGGRLLLKKALVSTGFSPSLLAQIGYSEQGKPSLKGLEFSISHSNGYVVLVFGTTKSLGIDIEKKKNIDLKLFEYLFTEQEWNAIMTAENQQEKFYWFWVRKEALLKVAGAALKELKQLEVFEHHGIYKGIHYFFKPFDFDADFNGMLAMEKKEDIDQSLIELKDLLSD